MTMRILVCLKLVSQRTFTDAFDSDSGKERLTGSLLVINPADEFALELALRVKDQEPDTHISVITMAPQNAEQMLRSALAMGADSAYHICDKEFAGSDTIATASVLSAAVKLTGPYDLILCGKNAIDSETGHIGPQMAALLQCDFFSNVLSFSKIPQGISITRAEGNGCRMYFVDSVALFSVVNGTSIVRKPTVLGYKRAKTQLIQTFTSADITPVKSGTMTLQVIENSFIHRHGIVTRTFETGISDLLRYLKK